MIVTGGKNNWAAVIAVVSLLAIVAGYAAYQSTRADEAEANLAFETAKIIDVKFAKTTTLRVATISGKIIARADDAGFAGLIPSSQTRKLPFATDYFVEFGKIGINNYRWSESDRTMVIEIPDVTISKPNIDEASQVASSPTGVFVSRGASTRLQQQLSSRAVSAANAEAKKPENLEKARQSAQAAVQNIVGAPLKAAGLGNVVIVTRFPWERRGLVTERWNESTPLSEIVKRVEASK
jgi:Protein of unknown function (DUF4230)